MKIISTSILAVLFITAGYAQDKDSLGYPSKGDIELGIGAAYNSSGLASSFDLDEYDTGSGYAVHGQFEYYLSENFGLKSRLNFDYKGLEQDSLDFHIVYLSVPVLFSWHFGEKRRWYMHLGPYVSGLLFAELDDVDRRDDLDPIDYGSDFGIGVRIPAKSDKWFYIDYDIQVGFSDPFKEEVSDFYNLVRSSLGFGLIF